MNRPNLSDFKQKIGAKSSALAVLKNKKGMELALCNYGARIVTVLVPDKMGNLRDVALGFNHIQDYIKATERYFGVTVGRFANRISQGRFSLHGQEYLLDKNNGPNSLHGGAEGFQDKVWDSKIHPNQATFYYVSPDGEGGYPGELHVCVQYELTEDNEIVINYSAKADKDTVLNLTNHAYFNLDGEGSGDIWAHETYIAADHYLEVDNDQVPTGKSLPTVGTAFDFNVEKALGHFLQTKDKELGGYDHCYVLKKEVAAATNVAARVRSPQSGICLEVLTTEPGVQLYTGNNLIGDDIGKTGKAYGPYSAFCLETQHFPDSPNQLSFPSTLLPADKPFASKTIYKFSVTK